MIASTGRKAGQFYSTSINCIDVYIDVTRPKTYIYIHMHMYVDWQHLKAECPYCNKGNLLEFQKQLLRTHCYFWVNFSLWDIKKNKKHSLIAWRG